MARCCRASTASPRNLRLLSRFQHAPAADALASRAILSGKAPQIIDALKKMEAIGFSEIILYFNVGPKPHSRVEEEMARFMEEVAPAFRR